MKNLTYIIRESRKEKNRDDMFLLGIKLSNCKTTMNSKHKKQKAIHSPTTQKRIVDTQNK